MSSHDSSFVSLLTLLYSEYIKEPAAEFFGVMILIIFGNGVDCQTVLSKNTAVASAPLGVSILYSTTVATELANFSRSRASRRHHLQTAR